MPELEHQARLTEATATGDDQAVHLKLLEGLQQSGLVIDAASQRRGIRLKMSAAGVIRQLLAAQVFTEPAPGNRLAQRHQAAGPGLGEPAVEKMRRLGESRCQVAPVSHLDPDAGQMPEVPIPRAQVLEELPHLGQQRLPLILVIQARADDQGVLFDGRIGDEPGTELRLARQRTGRIAEVPGEFVGDSAPFGLGASATVLLAVLAFEERSASAPLPDEVDAAVPPTSSGIRVDSWIVVDKDLSGELRKSVLFAPCDQARVQGLAPEAWNLSRGDHR